MKFHNPNSEVLVPDGRPEEEALRRTTHLGFGAHQDDLEILAFHGILNCLTTPGNWFTGVTCTDGAGSPRAGRYADFSDEQMQELRWQEQRRAATIGRYAAIVQLKHPSSDVKKPDNPAIAADFDKILSIARPSVVYTHNLADKHDTHAAVVLKVISALRKLPKAWRPGKVYGVEVWRGLDWMPDAAKVVLDVSGADHLAAALIGVYDSQIAGGKRYDLATMGRWRANATYLESHGIDKAQMTAFAMDLTPLVHDSSIDVVQYAVDLARRFQDDIGNRLSKHVGR